MGQYQSEEEMLKNYKSSDYVTPDGYTSDIAVFTIIMEQLEERSTPKATLKLMLIQRAKYDNQGKINVEPEKWALPGGFVQPNETALDGAARELHEETGVNHLHLKHFGVYDTPGRDKRGWIISNAFYAIVPERYLAARQAADDAQEVMLFSIDEINDLPLAFDHDRIIQDAIAMIQKELLQTTVAKEFLPHEFTLEELRQVLLTVTDAPGVKNKSSFFRKAPTLPFIEPAVNEKGEIKKTDRHSYKPTTLYRMTDTTRIPSLF